MRSASISPADGPAWYTYLFACLRPRPRSRPTRSRPTALEIATPGPGPLMACPPDSEASTNQASSPFTPPSATPSQADEVRAVMARLDTSPYRIHLPPHAPSSSATRPRRSLGVSSSPRRPRRPPPWENSFTPTPFTPSRSLLGRPSSPLARQPRRLTHTRSSSLSSSLPLRHASSAQGSLGNTSLHPSLRAPVPVSFDHAMVPVTTLRFDQLHGDTLGPRQPTRYLPLSGSATRSGLPLAALGLAPMGQEGERDMVTSMSDPRYGHESASSSLTYSSSPPFGSYPLAPQTPTHSAHGGPSFARRLVHLSLTDGRTVDTPPSSYPSPLFDIPSSSSGSDGRSKHQEESQEKEVPPRRRDLPLRALPPLQTTAMPVERTRSSSCLPTPTPSRVHSMRARSTQGPSPPGPSQGQLDEPAFSEP